MIDTTLLENSREIAENLIRNGGVTKDQATHALDITNSNVLALAADHIATISALKSLILSHDKAVAERDEANNSIEVITLANKAFAAEYEKVWQALATSNAALQAHMGKTRTPGTVESCQLCGENLEIFRGLGSRCLHEDCPISLPPRIPPTPDAADGEVSNG